MTKRIISFILVIAMLLSVSAIAVSAAGEEFISEVALIYEDSVEDAKAAIAGTDWKLFEYDLNPNADYIIDDGVYLIYKTSTNVEDAITDLRVMDMYGGFSTSNYERQLEESRQEYLAMCKEIRTAASEFKTLYEAGDEMAKLAYRQMNYYKDIGETDMLMGDFMLNIPSDDALITVLLEGNSIVVTNLISLLAIGISNASHTLAERVAELYAARDTLTDEVYYDDAVALSDELTKLTAKIKRYDALKDKYDLLDDEMSEEEYNFLNDVCVVVRLAESIQLGDVTLADMLRAENWTLTDVYPLVAAFSAGQMALISMGAFELTLTYADPSDSIEALNEMLDEQEKKLMDEEGNIRHIDAYIGVDRSIFNGTFAMTSAAERQQALTGKTWDMGSVKSANNDLYLASAILGVVDAICWLTFIYTIDTVPANVSMTAITYTVMEGAPEGGLWLHNVYATKISASGIMYWTAVALALVVAGLVGISTWYGYYNPDYTAIPDTMIDVRETDLGDKYIKYTAAKVYNDKEGRNADLNAYQGKEWIALYYTKDATAGKCLTPNFVYSDNNSTIARRHQGIAMFGETQAFNLNSHVYSKNAPGVYVTMRYSTAKKEAADLPTVVGSMFGGAFYALAAIGGIAVGAGATVLAQKGKKKETTETA